MNAVLKAKYKIDVVFEIWLDALSDLEIRKLIAKCASPVIAVCRGVKEMGGFRGDERARIEKLKHALACGAACADLGMHTDRKLIQDVKKTCKKHNAKLILSEHFWDKTPPLENLEKKISHAAPFGAFAVKIATRIVDWSDNVILFEFVTRLQKKKIRNIVVGMGDKGKISRFACPILGSYLTFAALDEKSRTAPGQITIKEFLNFAF